jgi:hypothetical protein
MARRRKQPEEESGGYSLDGYIRRSRHAASLLLRAAVSFSSIDALKGRSWSEPFGRSAVPVEQSDTKQIKEEAITIEGVEKREKDSNKPVRDEGI